MAYVSLVRMVQVLVDCAFGHVFPAHDGESVRHKLQFFLSSGGCLLDVLCKFLFQMVPVRENRVLRSFLQGIVVVYF